MAPRTIPNFGHSIVISANEVFTPRSEAEVLEILGRCGGRKIRVIGRLHSWSETLLTEDVLLDMRQMNDVRVEKRDGRNWVTVGAGCQIKRVLSELERLGAGTTPSLGLITEQAIAGAMATGTHGSGKHSLSHYADEMRIAVYDPVTGQPTIRTICSGDELRAARCSLGAMGVVVSVGFWARPEYQVEEYFERYNRLDDVLARETEFPLQQFYLIPWLWQFFGQHRRESKKPRSALATVYRWYFYLVIDVGLHLCLLLLSRVLKSSALIKFFFRHIATKAVIRRWHVVDRSQDMLIMEHELFRHIEIEIFVTQDKLSDALSFTVEVLKHFDGDHSAIAPETRQRLQTGGLLADLDQLCGVYTHHYMICVRRILPDDTLISMASGSETPWYSLSFVSCARPQDRRGFFLFANHLCSAMALLFDGRPHWGKYCPLSDEEAARLYPQLPRFRELCDEVDSAGRFRNRWLNDVMFGSRRRM